MSQLEQNHDLQKMQHILQKKNEKMQEILQKKNEEMQDILQKKNEKIQDILQKKNEKIQDILQKKNEKVQQMIQEMEKENSRLADDKRIKEKENYVLERAVSMLGEKLQPHENLPFYDFLEFAAEKMRRVNFICTHGYVKSISKVSFPKMYFAARFKQIQSCELDLNARLWLTREKYSDIFKEAKFPSTAEIESCFIMAGPMPPKNKTELIWLITSTMEALVTKAVNVILEKKYTTSDLMSYNKAVKHIVDYGLNCRWQFKVRFLEDSERLVNCIHSLRPGGCFSVQARNHPIMICEYKTSDEITKEDYQKFQLYCKTLEKAGVSPVEMFYSHSKPPEYENNFIFNRFMQLLQHTYNHMIKYNCMHAYITSGHCWLFLLIPQDGLGTLKHSAIFIEDEESWRKVFNILFSILLKSSSQMMKNPKLDEDGDVDMIYQLFKEGLELAKPKGTKRKKGDNDNNEDNGNDESNCNNNGDNDKNDKINEDRNKNTTIKNNHTNNNLHPIKYDELSMPFHNHTSNNKKSIQYVDPNYGNDDDVVFVKNNFTVTDDNHYNDHNDDVVFVKDDANDNDKNDKINEDSNKNTTIKNNRTSAQSRKNQPPGSNKVSKRPRTRSNIKSHSDNDKQHQQKHITNKHENKTEKHEDKKQIVKTRGISTTKPNKFVELSKKRNPPLDKYCTQKCLLGLKNNSPMDKKCPNYTVHAKNSVKNLHPIKYDELVTLFHEQVNNNIESSEYFRPKDDIICYMTKITVYPYGYTIIGKGSPCIYQSDSNDMKHEVSIYKHLDDLQGEWIPVFLGFIDLGYYCYILLSYGGENPETYEDFNHETVWKIEERIRDRGVRHNDVRLENIVLNKEVGHEMLIDFRVSYCER